MKNEMREVRQFHFTVWPDHGVPKYGTALLSFQKRIDKFHNRKVHGPMVVHCSAGVGRTGTFITIDTQLQKIKCDGTLDIFNFVRHLRYCRNYMVQTQVDNSRVICLVHFCLCMMKTQQAVHSSILIGTVCVSP